MSITQLCLPHSICALDKLSVPVEVPQEYGSAMSQVQGIVSYKDILITGLHNLSSVRAYNEGLERVSCPIL